MDIIIYLSVRSDIFIKMQDHSGEYYVSVLT